MWGCVAHWYQLPKFLRDAIWRHYRARQEVTKTPSSTYVTVARLVQLWIEASSARINGRRLTRVEQQKINFAFLDQMKAANL